MLIYAGGDSITWRRVPAEVYRDDCFAPQPLTTQNRHRLLAQMLGVREADLRWGAQTVLIISWYSDEQYLRDLGLQIGEQETRLRSTVQGFFAKGLLTRSQFEAVRPRLAVVVFDDRDRQVEPKRLLPLPRTHDARTSCRLATEP